MTEQSLIEWQLLNYMIKVRDQSNRGDTDVGKLNPSGSIDVWGVYGSNASKHLPLAAQGCLEKGYLEFTGEETVHGKVLRISANGELFAKGKKPAWTPPKPPSLTDRDYGLLCELDESWKTPLHCGGRNGSHHSSSLKKLVMHGLAEARNTTYPKPPSIWKRGKGSNRYRITAAGIKAKKRREALK